MVVLEDIWILGGELDGGAFNGQDTRDNALVQVIEYFVDAL